MEKKQIQRTDLYGTTYLTKNIRNSVESLSLKNQLLSDY